MKQSMMQDYLKETYYFDYSHHTIQAYLSLHVLPEPDLRHTAVKLYYLVRDGWKYSPYRISQTKDGWKASHVMNQEEGHCLDKSILLITLARACSIPARLHLVKVTNHIAVEDLIEKMGTNEMTPHGYVELFLHEKWVKATPAFNKELCDKLDVASLEFDGVNDSVFQQYSKAGNAFMEYKEDYGIYEDLPLGFIADNLREHYPRFITIN